MSSEKPTFFVTREHRRFAEFCDACRRYRYIGLCYGVPGVGKTLSARYYAQWDQIEVYLAGEEREAVLLEQVLDSETLLYTPKVLNGPGGILRDINRLRQGLFTIGWDAVNREEEARQAEARAQDAILWKTYLSSLNKLSQSPQQRPWETEPTLKQVVKEYTEKRNALTDPTTLIVVDEADRLKVASLEQMRAIFDQGGLGLVLLGMPGLEKRLARYPQLYSRVGFVHEFRSLPVEEVRSLFEQGWKPQEVSCTLDGIREEEVLASIFRTTAGNFRLLHRLLTQIARVLEINALTKVTCQVVETARDSLVIGSS